MTDFSQLPGAPPPGDPGWAPHQGTGPNTAIPDAVPFQPQFVNPADLTPQQKHAMRQAIASGDQAQYQAFLNSLDGGQQNVPDGPAALAARAGGNAGTEVPLPAPVPATPDPEVDAWLEVADALEAYGSDLEAFTSMEPQLTAFQERLAAIPEDQREAHLVAGDEQVLAKVYKGSDAAMRSGCKEIERAALLVGVSLESINDSGVLTDPSLHLRILMMARNIGAKS